MVDGIAKREATMSAMSQPDSATLSVPEGAKTVHDTLADGRYHLLLGLSPEFNGVLEELAIRYRMDKAEMINTSVGLLKYLSDAVREGKSVWLVSGDEELDTQITGL